MQSVLLSIGLAALVGTGVATLATRVASAADAKNLKVLPPDISKVDLKRLQAAALGVECEHCHNTDNFA